MDSNDKRVLPQEDIDFERELYERQKREIEERARLDAEREKAQAKAKKEYEKSLNDRKIELMKLKQGVIESSDVIKEEEKVKTKLSFGETISNIWYRSKWLIIFAAFCLVAFGYITFDAVFKTKPDLTVLVLSYDDALYYRSEEVETFLEGYCDDLNGDGEVYVLVYNISTDYSDPNTVTSNQAQLMSQLQTGENIIVISDCENDFIMHDFRAEYPDNPRFTERGMLINCALTREQLKWQAMPESLYIGMRQPAKLLSTSEETMQENFNQALPMFERIVEAITESEP
ncbi:MAG: hypothetical protein IJ424_08160 [Oscillospiraceae bacterium]|nr:hypothetical protein [Oscillospiraceae bacterium]